MMPQFDQQPTHLQNEYIRLEPLQQIHNEGLYIASSDPLIWEQHPSPNRYQREEFEKYFHSALECKTAFVVFNGHTNEIIGCSRYYEYNPNEMTVAIGFTFLVRRCWGTGHNKALKQLMIDHAFTQVSKVIFHIGENNIRSQKAVEKIGAHKTKETEGPWFNKNYFFYEILKQE
jgi:RimJ/RimL family protein N-acetyltransferase